MQPAPRLDDIGQQARWPSREMTSEVDRRAVRPYSDKSFIELLRACVADQSAIKTCLRRLTMVMCLSRLNDATDTTMRRPERLERRETSAVARCNEAYVCGCTGTYSGTLSSDLEAIASTTGKRAHQLIVCPSP